MRSLIISLIIFLAATLLVWQSGLIKITKSSEIEVDEQDELVKVGSIGYANWVPAGKSANKRGLVYKEENKLYPAPALYAPANMAQAFLVAPDGNNIHTWNPQIPGATNWQHVLLLNNGDILAIAKDKYLARIDWDSKVVWKIPGRYHHDVSEAMDGSFYSLKRVERFVEFKSEIIPIVDDYIDHISNDGKVLNSYSVWDAVKEKAYPELLQKAKHKALEKGINLPQQLAADTLYQGPRLSEDSKFDVLHTNSVIQASRSIPGVAQPGDLLISARNIDLIAIINLDNNSMRWSWGQGELDWQHHPTFLDDGKILIFDNRPKLKHSRVIELDPQALKVTWEFSPEKPRFYSARRGSAQRLPNGNTFITESDRGKVLEVTRTGEVVWEYYNPNIKEKAGKQARRSAIYRMIKYPGFVARQDSN